MYLDNNHFSFVSSYSAYDRRLTILVIQLSIYVFCILEDETQENEMSSLRRASADPQRPFKEPITEVMA